jgi:hypothetical protein
MMIGGTTAGSTGVIGETIAGVAGATVATTGGEISRRWPAGWSSPAFG